MKSTFSLINKALLVAVLGPVFWACPDTVELPPLEKTAPGQVSVLDNSGPEGDTGWWPSIAFDTQDIPHISYCDAHQGDLRYATKVMGAWQVSSVLTKGNVGKYTAIGADSKGGVGIVFYDQDVKWLRYAHRDASSPQIGAGSDTAGPNKNNLELEAGWKTERIAWGLEIGVAAELRFDADDRPHVFYYIPSGRLAHAYRVTNPDGSGSWKKEVVADATGSFTVRIDAELRDEGFWVSYVDWNFSNTSLFLASPLGKGEDARVPVFKDTTPERFKRKRGAIKERIIYGPPSFHRDLITDRRGPGWRSQLLFFGELPHMLYSLNRKPYVYLASPSSEPTEESPFSFEHSLVLTDVNNFAAVKTGPTTAAIAYEDIKGSAGKNGVVRYATLKNGVIDHRYAIDNDGANGKYLTMAANSQGQIVIVYYASAIKGLKVYDETL